VTGQRATTERLGSLSGGVFTVAITIMVLDLKPPERPTFEALLPLWSTVLSHVVSYYFIAIVWLNHHHLFRFFPRVSACLIWVNFLHLFMVTLVRFSTTWVARTKLTAVPVFIYSAVFVLVNLANIPFEWHVLAFTPNEQISVQTQRFARARSSVTLGTFIVAMVMSLKSPLLSFGLICWALLFYLRPELPGVSRTLVSLLRAVLQPLSAGKKVL
jgi:uncharacterized membrane protein